MYGIDEKDYHDLMSILSEEYEPTRQEMDEMARAYERSEEIEEKKAQGEDIRTPEEYFSDRILDNKKAYFDSIQGVTRDSDKDVLDQKFIHDQNNLYDEIYNEEKEAGLSRGFIDSLGRGYEEYKAKLEMGQDIPFTTESSFDFTKNVENKSGAFEKDSVVKKEPGKAVFVKMPEQSEKASHVSKYNREGIAVSFEDTSDIEFEKGE